MPGRDRRRALALVLGLILSLGAATANARDTRTGFPMPHLRVDPPTSDLLSVSLGFEVPDPDLGGTWQVALAVFAGPPSGLLNASSLGTATMTAHDWPCTGAETPADPTDDTFADVDLVARPRVTESTTGVISPKLASATVLGTLTGAYAPISNPCAAGTPPSGTLSIPFELRLKGVGRVGLTRSNDTWTLRRDAKGTIVIGGATSSVTAHLERQLTWAPPLP